MSLTGNLEDLPLLDILQIVSFSKKTGYLTIRTEQGEGAIVFTSGFVVASFTWDSPLPDSRAATLPPEKRAALIRNRIAIALEQLIRLREGQFSFNLTARPPNVIGERDISLETLSGGINPQELLLDLARGIDEDRRDSTAALEASFAAPPDDFVEGMEGAPDAAMTEFLKDVHPAAPEEGATEAPVSTGSTVPVPLVVLPPLTPEEAVRVPPLPERGKARPGTILLVDDEEDVRRTLAERFADAGYRVVQAQDPDSAAKTAGRLAKEGIAFLVVTDLGMPSSGGSSFQGGFEVVKRLWKMHLEPPVLLMTESLSPALQSRARQMGIGSVVFKPGLSKLDPKQFAADLRAFASKLSADVLPHLTSPGHQKGRVAPVAATEAHPADASKQLTLLLKRLQELRQPGDATRISSVVMKVAREFFERGILFLVKNEEVRGLGAFGVGPRDGNLNLLVRDVVIPLSEPSVFQETVAGCRTFTGPLPSDRWTQNLMVKVGRFKSGEAALIPLLAHRETIALLFGDNPETGRALSSLEALEVFIHHAGVALENAFLQRKIQSLQQRE
jgi:CheY-like chemotaxis protein